MANPTAQAQIRIGTRGSQLARWQSDHVADLIRQQHPQAQTTIQVISTQGDEILDRALPLIGGKGLFTEALEVALRSGEIDCAVHSLKDLPTDDAHGLTVGAIPVRADVRDALVSRDGQTLEQLPHGATIGTSSRRRAAQVLHQRPDLHIIDIRGNVQTRLNKVYDPDTPYDATLLAKAGLDRLGLSQHITQILDLDMMLPAPAQGALGIQCRAEATSQGLFAPLTHDATRITAETEREFLHALGGGCSVPVAAYALVDGDQVQLRGRVIAVDGSKRIDVQGSATLAQADEMARDLAQQALAQGADVILAAVQAENDATHTD